MSSTKTNSQMLKSIRQFNKKAREIRAAKLGFSSADDLILYLQGEINRGMGGVLYDDNAFMGAKPKPVVTPTPTPGKTKGKTPIIHIVDILDASGSMTGGKFTNALTGINKGVKELQEDTAKVKYTYTLCDFSGDIIFKTVMSKISDVGKLSGNTRGSTSLFDAIGETVNKVNSNTAYRPGDKVLVNIYTDGQENSSRKFKAYEVNELIKNHSEDSWTFTFIGTEEDVAYAAKMLSIKESNTLVYDGSAEGLASSFMANSAARSCYSKKVELGEDVSEGFYKDIK